VAAVAPDFRTTAVEGNGAAPVLVGDDEAAPFPDGEKAAPSRRERRKAKRRARRIARGRRLVTFRTLIVAILLAALVVGAFAAVRWYNMNSYYVGVDNNELIIYQGRIGGVLWYHPTAVDRTGVTTADVPSAYLGALNSGVEESSLQSACTYVSNLVASEQQLVNPNTPAASPTACTTGAAPSLGSTTTTVATPKTTKTTTPPAKKSP